ncbi:hypothetical protein OXX79_011668 [Metschnikowia pulcherrima]
MPSSSDRHLNDMSEDHNGNESVEAMSQSSSFSNSNRGLTLDRQLEMGCPTHAHSDNKQLTNETLSYATGNQQLSLTHGSVVISTRERHRSNVNARTTLFFLDVVSIHSPDSETYAVSPVLTNALSFNSDKTCVLVGLSSLRHDTVIDNGNIDSLR